LYYIFDLELDVHLADNNNGANAPAISPSKPPATTAQPQMPSSHAGASYYDQSGGGGGNKSKRIFTSKLLNLSCKL
jgi:hypothetical protein